MAKEYIEREAMMLDFERRYRDYRARSEKPVSGGLVEIDKTLQVAAIVMKSCLDTMHDAPAADVVEVVRCKDCRGRNSSVTNNGRCLCERISRWVFENDFCSHGERKDNETE